MGVLFGLRTLGFRRHVFLGRLLLQEGDEKTAGFRLRFLHGNDVQGQHVRLPVLVEFHLRADPLVRRERLLEVPPQLDVKLRARQLQDVEACGAGGGIDVRARVPPEVEDVQVFIHQNARRTVHLENLSVRQSLEADDRPCVRARLDPILIPGNRKDLIERRDVRDMFLGIDPGLPVHEREEIRRIPDRLGGSQHQVARRKEGVVKNAQHLLLGGGLQIDEKVPAADQIHP